MASILLDPAYRRLSVEEFLAMDLGDAKAELDEGIIFMMSGGSVAHARIAGNIFAYLRSRLRGTGCRPFGSDLAVRTDEASIRFPDVSVYCGPPTTAADSRRQLLGDPQVVVEVLSPSTARHDQTAKLEEYRALAGVREIVFADPDAGRVRLVARGDDGGWTDRWLVAGADVPLASLGLAIPHDEVFADD